MEQSDFEGADLLNDEIMAHFRAYQTRGHLPLLTSECFSRQSTRDSASAVGMCITLG